MKYLIISLFVCGSVATSLGQSIYGSAEVVPFGAVERIQSAVLQEERVLNIYLPQGYHKDSVAYRTLYLLDGSAHEDYPHVAGLVQFMQMYQLIPDCIVVGIANVDRYRDFSYPSSNAEDLETLPTSGGGEAFVEFIERELIPFVETSYNVNEHRTIIGQSMGGLIATEILMRKEHLFTDYIVVSPSLWWNDQKLVNSAMEHFADNTSLHGKIYLSLGEEHPVMLEVAKKLHAALINAENKQFSVFFEQITTEDHATILHKAIYHAFEAFYPREKH